MEQNLNDRSLEELEERYRELQLRIQEMDFENLTEQDRKDLQEQQEIKQFYTETATALAFVSMSAGIKENSNGDVRSIMDSEQYAELRNALTNGNDVHFVELLQAEKVSELTLEERTTQETAPMLKNMENAVRCAELCTALEQNQKAEYTVGDVKEAVVQAERIMQEYSIDKEYAFEQTDACLTELCEENKAYTYEPVTITETNDGYIQNTSRPLTAADTKEVAVKYNVENGNEIHHEVPAETTHDLSQVSPVVHLEEGTVSTLEAEVGITEDMKAVNKNSNDYER